MYEKQIGIKLSKLREEQGLTAAEVAKRVGISRAQISRLENGRQGFRRDTLERIAHALGVKPVYFYLEDDDANGGDELIGAPGRLGEALTDPGFRDLAERAAGFYLTKPEEFARVETAIRSAVRAEERKTVTRGVGGK